VIADISGDQDFANIRLIAEPWDPRSYELGRSFPGHMWGQWNGKFRDDVRSFVKSDDGKIGALMNRIYGSDDLFPDGRDDAYHPYQSINLITSHDGFCLYDRSPTIPSTTRRTAKTTKTELTTTSPGTADGKATSMHPPTSCSYESSRSRTSAVCCF
jgi:pullulanase/glycogen debranching enzyme